VHTDRTGLRLTGASDHRVSEALYLADPDGHGIEIYWDRPRSEWEGRVAELMTTAPLDFESLFAELQEPPQDSFEGLPAGTTMGHVHLKVADLSDSVAFYRDLLGFELMATFADSAAFLAAGGYHHHLGINTWQSRGAAPPPQGAASIAYATFVLPTDADRDSLVAHLKDTGHEVKESETGLQLRDPSGLAIALEAGPRST
jgi:catechol 2,3-dioxygenase